MCECEVGSGLGFADGLQVGEMLGSEVGCLVGSGLGLEDGLHVGEILGCEVGSELGIVDGLQVGEMLGLAVMSSITYAAFLSGFARKRRSDVRTSCTLLPL